MSNTIGRPKKFTTADLHEIITLYLRKNKGKVIRLSASKLASYSTNQLGKKAHYQDFTRNLEIKNYIEDFNAALIKKLANVSDLNEDPIYEKLNVMKFLKSNNTPKKLEKALIGLDKLHEKIHDSYGLLQEKYIAEQEKKHELESKINTLEKQLSVIANEHNDEIRRLKNKFKLTEDKSKTLREKNKILESFLKKYFYEEMGSYALYIEGLITSGVEHNISEKFSFDNYKNGYYDFSEVIKTYDSLLNNSVDYVEEIDCFEEVDDKVLVNDKDDSNQVIENQLIDNRNKDSHNIKSREKKLEEEIFGGNY